MLKRLALLSLVCTLPFVTGCGVFMAGALMDKATDNMIKLMEAEARIEKEKRAESYTIEGRFGKLEMKTEEVGDTDPSNIRTKTEGNQTKVERPTRKISTCIITFEDGREKAFRNVPPRELEKGKRYLIKFNGMNEITEVQELK